MMLRQIEAYDRDSQKWTEIHFMDLHVGSIFRMFNGPNKTEPVVYEGHTIFYCEGEPFFDEGPTYAGCQSCHLPEARAKGYDVPLNIDETIVRAPPTSWRRANEAQMILRADETAADLRIKYSDLVRKWVRESPGDVVMQRRAILDGLTYYLRTLANQEMYPEYYIIQGDEANPANGQTKLRMLVYLRLAKSLEPDSDRVRIIELREDQLLGEPL